MNIKNKFLVILSCIFMLICLTFTGCKPNEENTAYISASNTTLVLNQTYMVGDKLQLNGQKIDYFENIKNTVPTEKNIVVTNDMISGFNTENEGQFTLKINYKNALALSVNYTVYAVPSLKVYNGTYISSSIGKNTTIEISDNKATINYYEKGYVEYHYNSPTKTTEVDLTLGVLSNGNAKLSFVYENNKYFFSNFNENGKPSLLAKVVKDENGSSLISTTCTLLDKIKLIETAKQNSLRNAYTSYAVDWEYEAGKELYSIEDIVFVAKAEGTYKPAESETAATFTLNENASVYVCGPNGKYEDNGEKSLAVVANYIGEFNGYYAFHK